MNILHYTLGLPPYRSGGLTKYSLDLMISQSRKHTISLLYPGGINILYPKPQIKKRRNFSNISIYEIVNPICVPLLYGIKQPQKFLGVNNKLSISKMEKLYSEIKPDIFHIHTLMGIPEELIDFFKEKNVKIIYSTHDCFGLCLKTNFINKNNELCNDNNVNSCSLCNSDAPSELYLRIRNSPYILSIVKKIKNILPRSNQRKTAIKNNKTENIRKISSLKELLYKDLLEKYKRILEKTDIIHFNSSVTKETYNKYIYPKQSIVIPITHSGIQDNRVRKEYNQKKKIIIGFIGNTTPYKGLPFLIDMLQNITNTKYSWDLYIYGNMSTNIPLHPNIFYKGSFNNRNLKDVYNNLDFLIVPSICKETFSLVTLEAISFGVPVIVSDNVGAKDIIKKIDSTFIYHNKEELNSMLTKILDSTKIINDFNKKILNCEWEYSLENHTNNIINKLYL